MKLKQERIDKYNEAIGCFIEIGEREVDKFTEETSMAEIQQNGTQAILVITAEIMLNILRLLNQDG